MNRLRELQLDDTTVTDAGLAPLENLKHLEVLHLRRTRIGNAGLAHLKGLTGMKTLMGRYTLVDDDGLAILAGLPNLDTLELSELQVTDAGLADLAGLKNWHGSTCGPPRSRRPARRCPRGANLVDLNLDSCQINDRFAQRLCGSQAAPSGSTSTIRRSPTPAWSISRGSPTCGSSTSYR